MEQRRQQQEAAMALRINSEAPNFTAQTTEGELDFHQWIGDGFAVLFSHPKGRTAADNATVRSVFIIGPDKRIKATFTYPMSSGRNFDEVLRLIDSIQLTAKHKVATPVNWKQGEDVIIAPSVNEETARQTYP